MARTRERREKITAKRSKPERKSAAGGAKTTKPGRESSLATATRRSGNTAAPVRFKKATVTIAFTGEQDLRARLQALLAVLAPPAPAMARAAGLAADPCLDLFQSIQVVTDALHPKPFEPAEKLSDTYLTAEERELFQARVVDEVGERRCRIDADEVPAEGGTTHGNVVTAVREKARHKE